MPSRLSPRHRRWLYLLATLLWLSGLGWLVAHYGFRSGDPFAGAHPSEAWWLRVHGLAVIGFLMAFGALLPEHIRRGWRQGPNRATGLSMIGAVAVLALSGYGLYYLVDDRWRAWNSVIHWTIGLASGAVLAMHVVLGKRLRAQQQLTRAPHGPHHRPAARGPELRRP